MTDHRTPHLTDDGLNEFLDQALAAQAREAALAHLSICPDCSARLAALRSVFSELADLPPAPLEHDLRAGVLAAVRAQHTAPLRRLADPRQPAVQWVFGLQLLLALALLAFAWPFVASLALVVPLFGLGGVGPSDLATSLAGAWISFGNFWPALEHWLATNASQPAVPLAALPPVEAAVVLAAAGLGWLLGNAWLLRPAPRVRRR